MSDAKDYSEYEAKRYVKFLCCHSFANPSDAAKRRDPGEYRILLCKLLKANKTRDDLAGHYESIAALHALEELGKQNG